MGRYRLSKRETGSAFVDKILTLFRPNFAQTSWCWLPRSGCTELHVFYYYEFSCCQCINLHPYFIGEKEVEEKGLKNKTAHLKVQYTFVFWNRLIVLILHCRCTYICVCARIKLTSERICLCKKNNPLLENTVWKT